MRAVHPGQVLVAERLNADTQPVDALLFPEGYGSFIHVIGVYFKTDFHIGLQGKGRPGFFHDHPQFFPEQEGWGAAPKINRGDQPCIFAPGNIYLLQSSFNEVVLMLKRSGEMKITVMTGLFAKRDMKINAGKGIGWINHQDRSFV